MRFSPIVPAFILALALLLLAPGPRADTVPSTAIKTKILLRTTLSGDDQKEVVLMSAELAVGGSTGRHIHPGDEYATVLEGTLEIACDGQPPKRVKAGESYHNARGVVHETRNVSQVPVRIVATFVVDKGQPVMQPVNGPATAGSG